MKHAIQEVNLDLKRDPIKLAKEEGICSHFYANEEQLTKLLGQALKEAPPLGLLEQGRELPCYLIKIEEFYTPICYDPPAGRLVILAYDKDREEWLFLGTNWFAGVSDMMLPSHLFIDELDMLVNAVRKFSKQAKLRILSAVDILPTTRDSHLSKVEEREI